MTFQTLGNLHIIYKEKIEIFANIVMDTPLQTQEEIAYLVEHQRFRLNINILLSIDMLVFLLKKLLEISK